MSANRFENKKRKKRDIYFQILVKFVSSTKISQIYKNKKQLSSVKFYKTNWKQKKFTLINLKRIGNLSGP